MTTLMAVRAYAAALLIAIAGGYALVAGSPISGLALLLGAAGLAYAHERAR